MKLSLKELRAIVKQETQKHMKLNESAGITDPHVLDDLSDLIDTHREQLQAAVLGRSQTRHARNVMQIAGTLIVQLHDLLNYARLDADDKDGVH
jgi:hypothetical protein